jgi:hypothetical protein
MCCRTRVRRILGGVRRARCLRRVSHRRRRVCRHDRLRRERDLLRRRCVLETARLRRRPHRASLVHARGRCGVVVLSRRILDVALLRVGDVGSAGRSRVSSRRGRVIVRLLRIAWALFGWQVCVSAHGDGLAARGSSSHVSVGSVQMPLCSLLGSATEGKCLGKLTRMTALAA